MIIKTQWLGPKILGDGILKEIILNCEEYTDNINDKMIITVENKLVKENVEKQ